MAILAGGLGTRLRSVAADIPKSLVPVAGKPFIENQLALLRRHGIARVLLCVGHLGGAIERHVRDGSAFGVEVSYSREEEGSLMGTGGALVNALPLLEDMFLTLYGDSYLPTDYGAVVRAAARDRTRAMMCVYRNNGKWDPSNVRIAGGMVSFYAKGVRPGEADCIDYGLSAFPRSVIASYAAAAMPLDLARVQGELVRAGQMRAFEVAERFYEIGKPEGLAELDDLLAERGRA